MAAIAVTLVAVASSDAYQRVDYNHVPSQLVVGELPPGGDACQRGESLAAGTRALRIHIATVGRAQLRVWVSVRGAASLDGTGAPARLAQGPAIVVPLPREVRRQTTATICLINRGNTPLGLSGSATGTRDQIVVRRAGAPVTHMVGRTRIDDLLNARRVPGWRVLGDLPQRVTAATGTPLAPWIAGLALLFAILLPPMLLRTPATGSLRKDLLVVTALTLASGALWAGVTPALQKTDEPAHFAYVQSFSELGHPPHQFADTGLLSGEFSCWYNGLQVVSYRFFTDERPPWSDAVRRQLDLQCAPLSRRYDGAMYHAFQPPLYYGIASIGYLAGYDLPLPTRVMLVRMVSVMIAAAFVAFCYLLVRELVPDTLWSARAAAIAIALQPVVMFNLSGVNPDGLYAAATAAIALLAARAWRRGLTLSRALLLGAATGLGLVSKVNFLTFIPPLILLLVALWMGDRRQQVVRARRLLAGGGVTLGIFTVYVLVNDRVWHRHLSYNPPAATGHGGSLHRLLSFSWQFFLPRLPGMHNLVHASYIPAWNDFVRGLLTRLGWWDDYGLATIFIWLLVTVGVLLAAAAAAHLIPRVRSRPWPLVTAVGCGLAFLAALVFADYKFSLNGGGDQMESRYLLPLLPLWGLVVGSAIAAIPRRWRGSATALLAVGFLAYTVVAGATTIHRFYL